MGLFYSHFQILLLVIIYSAMLLVFITYVKMLREGKASTNDLLLTSILWTMAHSNHHLTSKSNVATRVVTLMDAVMKRRYRDKPSKDRKSYYVRGVQGTGNCWTV